MSVRRAVTGKRNPLMLFLGNALVSHQVTQIELNLNLVRGLAYLYDQSRPPGPSSSWWKGAWKGILAGRCTALCGVDHMVLE
jgi:hypothetical protein